jgi:hypothetical protein
LGAGQNSIARFAIGDSYLRGVAEDSDYMYDAFAAQQTRDLSDERRIANFVRLLA